MATVAVLGLGLLGAGFAENLLAKGHAVRVWNRSAEKAAPLVALGATAAATPAEAVAGAERVHLVLTADAAVDEVLAAARPGLGAAVPVLDHSTNSPAGVAERYARLRGEGVRYVHAPVFMAPRDARGATGILLFAAPQDEAEALTETFRPMTGQVWYVGDRPDLAAVYKLLGNATFVGLSGLMGDLLSVGQAQGLTPSQVFALFDTFRPGAALPAIGSRVAKATQVAPSFELTMARKDVRLMLDAAGGPEGLIVLPAVAEAMDEALAQGLGARDYSVFAWPRGR